MTPAILIVDDRETQRTVLSRLLGTEFAVQTAADFPEGERRLRAGRLDAVLVDFSIPGGDGLSLLRLAADLQPRAARILYTGRSDVSEEADPVVDRLVRKPCPPEEIFRALREAIRIRGSSGTGDRLSPSGDR